MLRLEPFEDSHPRYAGWATFYSGRILVGTMQLDDPGFRKPRWLFRFGAIHLPPDVVTTGGSHDRDRCIEYANTCWAAILEALALKPAGG